MASSTSLHLFTGQVLGFIPGKSSPYQFLHLRTPEGDRTLKLSKDLRRSLFLHLGPGDWVRILAKEKMGETGPEFKAKEVLRIAAPTEVSPPSEPPHPAAAPKSQRRAQVLVCQKSSCRKRGSEAVGRALETAIAALPNGDAIAVKATGCMDRCKAGPNVVFMPDKARYSRVTPTQVPALVERHLAPPPSAESSAESSPDQPQSKMASAGSGA